MEWLVVILMGLSVFNFNEAQGLKDRMHNVEVVTVANHSQILGIAEAIAILGKNVDAVEMREVFRDDKKVRQAVDKSIKKLELKGIL